MRAVNLIPVHRRAERKRRNRLRAWGVGLAAYAAALLIAALVTHGLWGGADTALADRLAAVEADAVEADAAEARETLTALEPQLATAMRKLETTRAIAVQPDWSLLLALLGDVRSDDLTLDQINLAPADAGSPARETQAPTSHAYRVGLTGVAEDQRAVSRFVLDLEAAALFDDVKLVETSRTTTHDRTAVAFRLLCRLGESREGGAP